MRTALFVMVALGLGLSSVSAQDRPIEIGVDGGFQFTLPEDGENSTSIFLPAGWLRVGFFVSDRVELESLLGFSHFSMEDYSSTQFQLMPYLAYHFKSYDEGGPLPYVRVGAGLAFEDYSGESVDAGETRFGVGVGLGVKFPMTDRLRFRVEGAFDHWFETDDYQGFNLIQILVGFSFFTK